MSDFPCGLDVDSKKNLVPGAISNSCKMTTWRLGGCWQGLQQGEGTHRIRPTTPETGWRSHGLPKGRPLEKEPGLNISYSQRRSSFMSGLVISQARMRLSRLLFSPPSPDSSLVFSDMTEGENKKTAWRRLTLPFPPKAHGQPTADPGRRRERGWNWNSDGRVKH